MRKKLCWLLLVVAAMLGFPVNAAAAEATEPQLYYITDAANLLGDREDARLEKMAEAVSQKYGVGVYVVTIDDYQDFNSEGVYEATYTIYHDYTMGEGADRNGIMLLLSTEDRNRAIFCYGKQCEYAFNSYGQEQLETAFLDNFADDDWSGGFEDYITTCEEYLEKAAEGKPVRKSPIVPILIVTGMSLLAAFIVLGFLWAQMDKVAEKTTANAYIAGALNLTEKTDTFTYRTQTRRKIEKSSSNGGSRSESGGGGSRRSGKF